MTLLIATKSRPTALFIRQGRICYFISISLSYSIFFRKFEQSQKTNTIIDSIWYFRSNHDDDTSDFFFLFVFTERRFWNRISFQRWMLFQHWTQRTCVASVDVTENLFSDFVASTDMTERLFTLCACVYVCVCGFSARESLAERISPFYVIDERETLTLWYMYMSMILALSCIGSPDGSDTA